VHRGEGSFHKIKEREKIFGTDVILVHRLLKNNIPEREYLLVTDSISSTQPNSTSKRIDWKTGTESYDFGHVDFKYIPLESWYDNVPEPVLPEPTIYRVRQPIVHSIAIAAPMEMVYDILIDLSQRKNFMVGMKGLSIKDKEINQLNRICTTFQCSLEHEKCTFETSSVHFSQTGISFTETLKEYPVTFDYVLQRNYNHTLLSLRIHPALRIPKKWLFDLLMKRKMANDARETLQKLKLYCETKADAGIS